ncbi:MAG: beta strand repeat-containing protein [Chitinophagaceae bacterium]
MNYTFKNIGFLSGMRRYRLPRFHTRNIFISFSFIILSFFTVRVSAQSITITSVTPNPVCAGTNVTINVNSSIGGTKTYTANLSQSNGTFVPSALATNTASFNGSGSIVIAVPSTATPSSSYIVTVTQGATTGTSSAFTISAAAPTALTYSSTPVTYCASVAITANSPSNSGGAPTLYTVSPALPAGLSISSTTGIITGTPTTATAAADYTVTATNSCGNTTKLVNITVTATPVISGNLGVCAGFTTQLSGSGQPAVSNPWISSNPAVASVSSSGLVTAVASSGTTTITYTDINGCQKTATITVNPIPTVTGNLNVCNGASTLLTGSGTPASSNPWVSSNTGVAIVSTGGVVTSVAPGTADITYTDNNGCQKTVTVMIKALPAISGNLSICKPEQLTGSGTAALVNPWVSSNTSVATINSSGIANGVTAGNTTITYTDNNGCQASVSLTVDPLPSITGNLTVCPGATSNLRGSGTGAATNSWTSSNTAIATISITSVTPAAATVTAGAGPGTTNITYTDDNGCQKIVTFTVYQPTVNTSAATVCVGGTTTLNAPGAGAGTWASSDITKATVSGNTATGVAPGGVTFTFTETATNCSNTTSSVTVNAKPTVNTSAAAVCVGGTITLNAPGAGAGTWISNDISKATVSGNTATGVAPGGVTFTFTETATNCSNTTSSVTVNGLSTISLTSAAGTNNQNACVTTPANTLFQTITYGIGGTATGATSSILPAGSGLTGSYNPGTKVYTISGTPAVGTYTYTVTANGPCPVSATGTIKINPVINPTSVVWTQTATCSASQGVVFNLTTTPTGGAGAPYTYQWYSSKDCGSNGSTPVPGATSPSYTPTDNDCYWLQVYSGGCEAYDKQVGGTQRDKPKVDANISISSSNGNSLCIAGTTTLTASSSATYTYSWNPATYLNTTSGPTVVFSGAPAGSYNYTVTGVDAGGCTKTATVTVVVNPLPTATISGTTAVCLNATAPNITFTGAGGTAPYTFTYNINNGSNLTVTTTSGNSINVPVSTAIAGSFVYTLISVKDSKPCSQTAPANTTATVTVNTPPVATITGATSFCAGGNTVLSATSSTAGSGSITGYQWNLGGTPIPGATASTYTATAAGSYTVTVTNSNNCPTTSAATVVTVNALPTITTQPASQADCKGNNVDFSAAYSPSGTVSYQWQSSTDNGTTWNSIAGASGSTGTSPITYSAANIGVGGVNVNGTQYRVIITDAAGCNVTSNAATLTVNEITGITPGNTSTVICEGGNFSFNVTTSGNVPASYQWKKDGVSLTNGTVSGVITSGATSATLTITNASPSETGAYQVTIVFPITVPNNNGAGATTCTETSTLIRNVTVNPAPVVTVTNNSPICSGSNATFTLNGTASAVVTYNINGASNQTVTLTGGTAPVTVTGATANQTLNLISINNPSTTCSQNLSASSAVTVTANNTVGAASSSPTACINTAITTITHATTEATGIGTPTGLPAGVTAVWAGNTITISGTPTTAAGSPFTYSIPLTGGCGNVSATGTITVTPDNTVGAASSSPTACINTAITTITHATTGATGIGTPTGLPAGVTAVWAGNTITISGTPTTAAGSPFAYSIPLTGGCGNVSATGTITVNALPIITGTLNVCVGSTTQLTGSGTPAAPNAWVSATPGVATVNNSGLVTGIAQGTTIITYTDSNGCSQTATITVNPKPAPVIYHN